MCVVTEELSRGYIGVGSLGTRSEIAAELIRLGGTDEQKAPLPPEARLGRDPADRRLHRAQHRLRPRLAHARVRRLRDGFWHVTGAKNWITHAARADLMTLLVRTDPDAKGYRGLSMLLAEKPRGTDADPFPVDGPDRRRDPGPRLPRHEGVQALLRRLPRARGRTSWAASPARASSSSWRPSRAPASRPPPAPSAWRPDALELGLRYAKERQQFGKPLLAFPRVHQKLAWMAVEIMLARQLTLFAAREKDADRRCDLEAGLAKLLGASVAWAAADNALQIHGGNGYAVEYPISRVLCDARILNIFEGAAEIQAQVIARRLLEG